MFQVLSRFMFSGSYVPRYLLINLATLRSLHLGPPFLHHRFMTLNYWSSPIFG